MIVEGQRVTFVGENYFVPVGSLGKVVSLSGRGVHVLWSHTGAIELVDADEVLPYRAEHAATATRGTSTATEFDATLDMPTTATLTVRSTYDDVGEDGLVTALSETGHLAMLATYVDEAVGHLALRIRADPNFAEVLASLEADEADSLVAKVASTVMAERLTEDG